MKRLHASLHRGKLPTLRLSALLRQSPEAIAFLEAILGDGQTGLIKLHVKDGRMRSWAFTPGGPQKKIDTTAARVIE